jgi:phi LC3 family holin
MNINWKVRIKNKYFWLTLLPTALLLIQSIAVIFGIKIELDTLSGQLVDVIEALFTVLAVLGIVVDPTTSGVGDSSQAMQYTSPKKDSVG